MAGLVAFALAFVICGAMAEAQQPAKTPRIGLLLGASASYFGPALKHFADGCASLGMSKEKTLSLSPGYAEENLNGCLTLLPSWSVSKVDVIVTDRPGCRPCQEG